MQGFEKTQILFQILKCLKEIETDYPDVQNWFQIKVVPNIGEDRDILIVFVDKKLAGFSILKYSERKLCTFFILKPFRKQGLGTKLMYESIRNLKTEKPLVSVSQRKLKVFQKLFDNFNFQQTSIQPKKYTDKSDEVFFNEKTNIQGIEN